MSLASAFLGFGFFVSELTLRWRRRSTRGLGTNGGSDRGSLAVLWWVFICAINAGVLLALLNVGPRLPGTVPWGVVGTGIFLLGTTLRWWAIWYLGQFFTVDVAVAAGQRVVDDGPYWLVRHPSYTGLLLQFTGLGLALGNLLGFAAVFVPVTLALLHRIRVEEAALRTGLGEPYASYAQRTKKLVPFVF